MRPLSARLQAVPDGGVPQANGDTIEAGDLDVRRSILAALLEEAPGLHVHDDPDSLRLANTATFPTTTSSALVVRPVSTAEVSAVLRVASRLRLSVYPASTGRNYGFGSRVPVRLSVIFLDLSRMTAILEFDPRHGTLRVEPGVTFAQATAFLSANGGEYFLNSIGGSPFASLIGNVLERGDGAGHLCERASHVCDFEVVLPDGEVVHTGFANRSGSRLSGLSRHAPGPGLQDLFLQSNFGVVTAMTFWLQRRPDHFRLLQFHLNAAEALAPAIEAFRDLLKRHVIAGPVLLWNDYKVMAGSTRFPFHQTDGSAPLGRDQLKASSNAWRAWTGHGGIYLDDAAMSVAAARRARRGLIRALGRAVRVTIVSDRKIRFLDWLGRLSGGLLDYRQLVREWRACPALGEVSQFGMRSLYWRKRFPAPDQPEPLADRCGLLSNSFDLPLDGHRIVDMVGEIESEMLRRGFEPLITITIINDRYARAFVQLSYDRDAAGEDARAMDCHRAIFAMIESRGCTHSRIDIGHMDAMRSGARSTLLRDRIASALNPQGILAPGRYEF